MGWWFSTASYLTNKQVKCSVVVRGPRHLAAKYALVPSRIRQCGRSLVGAQSAQCPFLHVVPVLFLVLLHPDKTQVGRFYSRQFTEKYIAVERNARRNEGIRTAGEVIKTNPRTHWIPIWPQNPRTPAAITSCFATISLSRWALMPNSLVQQVTS